MHLCSHTYTESLACNNGILLMTLQCCTMIFIIIEHMFIANKYKHDDYATYFYDFMFAKIFGACV